MLIAKFFSGQLEKDEQKLKIGKENFGVRLEFVVMERYTLKMA